MNGEFKAGDIVELKSGGPSMTIQKVEQNSGEMTAWCQWFDGKAPMSGRFNLTSLRHVGG
jgi:uncharacterized protein YodC (DUF2158 family)